MRPQLEPVVRQTLNYGDLPETWRVPEIERFSTQKTLYDYQSDALRNAARALYLYYGKGANDWQPTEPRSINDGRRQDLANRYADAEIGGLAIKKYEGNADRQYQRQNPVFRILSEFITVQGEDIPYRQLINRMCFWMATGSGKTLVMVKLIEYLHSLKKHGEIPPHNILILAPSEHLIRQIRRTVAEFNQSGLHIDLVPLRDSHRQRQGRLGNAITVYYHRSDNISDVQKDALTDYRTCENGGKWYVLLDEAHKGGKEDSKRQAYYAVLARNGFPFNFSATFTDTEDILTTVKKYNLEEFVKHGNGKHIYLNEEEYGAFRNRAEEINHRERQTIVLKSLITLAYVSLRIHELRAGTGREELYHSPLMLTLVNSVNTDVQKEQNDLWAFFKTLREIATGEIDGQLFEDSKDALVEDWRHATLLFGEDGRGIIGTNETSIRTMTITDLREAVFLSRGKGALQVVRSNDNKELAFQMKNADSPFALIRIGDTSKWRHALLAGYDETTALREQSFFDELEQSPITILMGSRSFFESWDSNRPNVINFINIGGIDAKKFVVQSVGRGVRIEMLPGKRRRYAFLVADPEMNDVQPYHDQVQPAETLFLFATNRNAVRAVLEGLESEKGDAFENLEGFEQASISQIGFSDMPLLVPEYRQGDSARADKAQFAMSEATRQRFNGWIDRTSDSVFAVRDGLGMSQIAALHGVAAGGTRSDSEKNYASLPFLQRRLLAHLSQPVQTTDGVRTLDGEKDIIHFRHIRVHAEYAGELQDKIHRVKQGKPSDEAIGHFAGSLAKQEITREEFDRSMSGKDEETFKDLTIKKLLGHYYLPVVLGDERANYIQHIVKVRSEIDFLNGLEQWLERNSVKWDAWMFSKIDESVDDVHIPYYDSDKNEHRRFLPDFVFWMCRDNEYQIVFVDPKGDAHTSSYRKIDGYKKLFVDESETRLFKHAAWNVSVKLFFYNPAATPPDAYQSYWIDDPLHIFANAAA